MKMTMNDLVNLLNQNQGVLTVIGLGITVSGGIIAWIFNRNKQSSVHSNSPYIQAGHGVSAGGDIIVGGSKTQVANVENFPTVTVKPDSFTHNTGQFDLIFENTGSSTAVIQKLRIGDNDVNLDEFSLGPDKQTKKHLNVSGFKILEEKMDAPNFELFYKDLSSGKKYKTMANISQDSRDDGKYNLGKISGMSFIPFTQNGSTSNLEDRLLKKLYAKYQKTGRRDKWKAIDAFKELGIKNGQDLSTVHDSKFIKIELDGTHECFVLTSEGIRYMDNQ